MVAPWLSSVGLLGVGVAGVGLLSVGSDGVSLLGVGREAYSRDEIMFLECDNFKDVSKFASVSAGGG